MFHRCSISVWSVSLLLLSLTVSALPAAAQYEDDPYEDYDFADSMYSAFEAGLQEKLEPLQNCELDLDELTNILTKRGRLLAKKAHKTARKFATTFGLAGELDYEEFLYIAEELAEELVYECDDGEPEDDPDDGDDEEEEE